MHCTNCGEELRDGATFCARCGARMEEPAPTRRRGAHLRAVEGQEAASAEPETVTVEEPVTAERPTRAQPVRAPEGSSRKRIPIAVVIACLAIALAVVAGLLAHKVLTVDDDAPVQAVSEQSSTSVICVHIDAPGYAAGDSPIPLHVEGLTTSGEEISCDVYVDPNGAVERLDDGAYEVTFIASPLTQAGVVFQVPEEPVTLVVGEGAAAELSIGLTPLEPEDVTQDALDAALDAALASGFDEDTAHELYEAAAA